MSVEQYKYQQLKDRTDDELDNLEENEYLLQENLFSPHEQVQPTKETSIWKMTLNMFSYMEGVGFLAIPYSIREGGITAVIALFVLPFILGYTANLLSECVDERNEAGGIVKRRTTYQEVAKDSWTPLGVVVWTTNNLNLLMTTISYVVLCGSLMSQQFSQVPITESQWACIGTLVVLPTVFLKTLSHIAWLSLLSLISLTAVIGLMLAYEIPILALNSDCKLLLSWDTRGVFVALSILTGSYSIHPIVVSVAAGVRDQSRFKLALIFNYFFGAIFKIVFALSGFLAFSVNTKEVILNNVPQGIIAKIISTCFTLSVLLTYAIPFLVITRSIEQLHFYEKICKKCPPVISSTCLRFFLLLLVLFLAIEGRSHFALISALNGTTTILDCLLFPALFHLLLRHKKTTKQQIFVNCVFAFVSFAAFWFTFVSTIISFI